MQTTMSGRKQIVQATKPDANITCAAAPRAPDVHMFVENLKKTTPRISAKAANEGLKLCRFRLQETGANTCIVTNDRWWKQWIVHHARAHEILSKPIINAEVACIGDEYDYNKDFHVVDLILTYNDQTHVRMHPNRQNPTRVRFGCFSSTSPWSQWRDTVCATPPDVQIDNLSAGLAPSSRQLSECPQASPQEDWTLYVDEETKEPWWYSKATGQSRCTFPRGWTKYHDPESERYYIWHEDTQRVYFLP